MDSKKKNSLIDYSNLSLAICPIPHSNQLPISELREIDLFGCDNAGSGEDSSISVSCVLIDEEIGITTSKLQLIDKSELNELV